MRIGKKISIIKIILGLFIVFNSCSERINKDTNKEKLCDSAYKDSIIPTYDVVSKFDYSDIKIDTFILISRTGTPYNGNLDKKFEWTDLTGKNRLILSSTYDYKDGFGRAEIFAYQYLLKDKEWELVWRINDFVDGMGCDLAIDLLDFKLLDIDKSGTIETVLMYTRDCSCDAGFIETKLILVVRGEKIKVRGVSRQYLMPTEEIFNRIVVKDEKKYFKYKNLDIGSFTEDTIFVKYASDFWDEYINNENEQYKKEMELFRKKQEEEERLKQERNRQKEEGENY